MIWVCPGWNVLTNKLCWKSMAHPYMENLWWFDWKGQVPHALALLHLSDSENEYRLPRPLLTHLGWFYSKQIFWLQVRYKNVWHHCNQVLWFTKEKKKHTCMHMHTQTANIERYLVLFGRELGQFITGNSEQSKMRSNTFSLLPYFATKKAL